MKRSLYARKSTAVLDAGRRRCAVFALAVVAQLLLAPPRHAWAQTAPSNQAIARVNGEVIRGNDLNAGLPRTWFGLGGLNKQAKAAKYERLIDSAVMTQFLEREGIHVSKAEIDGEIERLRESPPAAGCSCCRYRSLESYMRDKGFTMPELRRKVANDLGLERAVRAEWEKLPADDRTPEEFDRRRIQRQFIKASHIFFNIFQKPDFRDDPESVERLAYIDAGNALRRLQSGDAFEKVTAAMSEDAISAPKGGLLGMIERWALGATFAKAVDALKPGEISKLVRTQWGVHIIRRESVNEADVDGVFRKEWEARRRAGIRRTQMNAARIEKLWNPDDQ